MSDEKVLAQARDVWRAARERDDALAAPARQRRLALGVQREERSAGGVLRALQLAAPLALVAAVGLVGNGPAPAARSSAPGANAEPPPVAENAAARVVTDVAPRSLRALAPCYGCRRAGSDAPSIDAGERLVPGERVDVPRGATLLLCWEIGAEDSQEEIRGPAAVVVTSGGNVATEQAEPAAAPGVAAPAQEAARPTEDPLAEWRAAQAALASGDRPLAERRLRGLLAMASAERELRERASFALAELELARGAKEGARVRLEALRASADPDMVADAAFLEARAADLPIERAAILRRYAAGNPPSPYRERALVDEALALLEAGEVAAARQRARQLRASGPLPSVVAAAFARLERELAMQPATPTGAP